MQVLQQMLWGNMSVKHFSASQCNLGDEGAMAVFDGLERNLAMRVLNLSVNQITDRAVSLLAKRVEHMQLRAIDLSGNYISERSGTALMEALGRNNTLETLAMNSNNLTDESAQELVQSLKKNRKLRRVQLGNNCINIRFIESVNEYLLKNEMLAMERVLPDIQQEIRSMATDKKEYDQSCKELTNVCINKSATLNRARNKEKEFEEFKAQSERMHKELQAVSTGLHFRRNDFEHVMNELDIKGREKTRYTDGKERELRAFITNTIKEGKTVDSDIEYYTQELRLKRASFEGKKAELLFELQETNRRLEVESRSYLTLLAAVEAIKKAGNKLEEKEAVNRESP